MKSTLIAIGSALTLAAGLHTSAAAYDHAIGLYNFDQNSGMDPNAGVIVDAHGTVFGTNFDGGIGDCGGVGCGTVFALFPPSGGKSWTFNVLYKFQDGPDGGFPEAPLTLGPRGSVFGSANEYYGSGYGTVFELLPPSNGGTAWTFQTLYTFTGGADGILNTRSQLIWHGGALYGIALGGSNACGQSGCGSVFELTPPHSGNGPWTETTLFNFTGGSSSGTPTSIVGFDGQQALYVSTAMGNGVVAQLAPVGGTWKETVLTTFKGSRDGADPFNLVLAQDGTLYGLASTSYYRGLVFQLTPPGGGHAGWTRTDIARINQNGYGPNSLSAGVNGTLIGTIFGDVDFFPGAVFQLTPNGGQWTYSELWNFHRGPDRNPLNVVTGRKNHLFGVLSGGDSTNGSLFELK